MSQDLQQIKELVDDLYDFRDNFFINNDIEDASKKDKKTSDKLDETIQKINNLEGNILDTERGDFFFLKGKALNVLPDYNKDSEECLGRATKFNNADAWNELGECQFKKGQLVMAKSCFQRAIDKDKKAVYLRNMSMLLRSLPAKDHTEKSENISKALEFATEALKLNFKDGHSWLVVGNSYLTKFFTFEAKQEVLKSAKSAYTKAEEDEKAAILPELHFSKFQIEWYEEDYSPALASLRRAADLEPTWGEPKNKLVENTAFLRRFSSLIKTKAQLSQSRLQALNAKLDDSHLGPYSKGGTSLTGGTKPLNVPLALLADGGNEKKICLGVVLCLASPPSGLPVAFCIGDKSGVVLGMTVYNWAPKNALKVGDAVAVLNPVLKRHKFNTRDEIDDFSSLRVSLPLLLVINGRCVEASNMIASQVVSTKKAD